MSQYFRKIVISDKTKNVAVKSNGKIKLTGDLVADIVSVNTDSGDGYESDELSRIDFIGCRNRITVKSGFTCMWPVPKFVSCILKIFGVRLDLGYCAILAALYEESGFSDFGREECDKMFINTILMGVNNTIVKTLLYDLLILFIGNNYSWNHMSEETTVATIEPIWNS